MFPACTLSYLGQGALILDDPRNIASPFFLLVPDWGRWPLVVLATAATVIASQAVITGAFSVAHQAVQLGYLPRLRIAHTSEETIGQIYVPWINWLLLVSVLTLVFTFESSAALAFAFGMAVTGTITITTLLFLYIVRHQWRRPLWLVVAGGGFLLTVDLLFLAANADEDHARRVAPAADRVTVFTVLTTWHRGRRIVTARREEQEGPLRAFVDHLHQRRPPVVRRARDRGVPQPRHGDGAARDARQRRAPPLAQRARRHPVDRDPAGAACRHRPTGSSSTTSATGTTGSPTRRRGSATWSEPDVPSVLRLIEKAELEFPIRAEEASYYLSTIDLARGAGAGPGPMAEDAVPRHLAHHRRRRRVLRPPPRADGDHRLADRGVVARPQARPR